MIADIRLMTVHQSAPALTPQWALLRLDALRNIPKSHRHLGTTAINTTRARQTRPQPQLLDKAQAGKALSAQQLRHVLTTASTSTLRRAIWKIDET